MTLEAIKEAIKHLPEGGTAEAGRLV